MNWISSTEPNDLSSSLVRELLPDREIHYLVAQSRDASYQRIPPGLDPKLIASIVASGIRQAYEHQVEAVEAALQGRDVVVTTGTGSGKSACGIWPALHRCLSEPVARALFVFPTK